MNVKLKTKTNLLLLLALFVGTTSTAQNLQRTSQGIKCTTQGLDIQVEFFSPSIIRVYKTPEGVPYQKENVVVTKSPVETPIEFGQNGMNVTLKSSTLLVELNPQTGGIRFYTASGQPLLVDKDYGTRFIPKDDAGTSSFTVTGGFALDKEEAIYGIGQVMDNKFDRRNSVHHMQNENMFTYSPYFMSVKGYAVYWDNYSISEFADTSQGLSFESLGHCADYYFMYGGNADGVVAQVRDLTGKAPMLPLWAYGFFQSKERYHTQEESLNVLKQYRKLQIPIDCIIQDWRYWPEHQKTDSTWNSHSFDRERFPEPQKWVDEIHKQNAKLLIVAWPGFGTYTEQRKELDAKNMIINFDTWPPKSGARPYDVYNPEALDIYWKYLNKGIYSYIGNDGWWLDSTEPDHINRKEEDYNLPTHLGSYRSVKNIYSLLHNSGIASHQKELNKDKRVVILTRSGFIGQQRYGSNTWSGDVQSTWDMLEKQIPAALNFTLMGIPNWNSDIGGFFAGSWNKEGGPHNPEYQELYVRWMQFGAFCPMMRSHGTGLPREIWNFGKRGDWCFDAQEKMIQLRYRLLPYIYSTSWDVSHNDGTFMRPLIMDFAADKQTHDIGNEYLFGRSLLVAPVTKPGVDTWPVYLPSDANWYNFWSNEYIKGGQTVATHAPKNRIPLYVKAGSILPFGPKVQYSTENKWHNLELRVYPGANATFTFYEDENDNYNYEQGAYTTIEILWNDETRTLTIGDRKGSFSNMLKQRKFKIVMMTPGRKSEEWNKPDQIVSYTGKKTSVKL